MTATIHELHPTIIIDPFDLSSRERYDVHVLPSVESPDERHHVVVSRHRENEHDSRMFCVATIEAGAAETAVIRKALTRHLTELERIGSWYESPESLDDECGMWLRNSYCSPSEDEMIQDALRDAIDEANDEP